MKKVTFLHKGKPITDENVLELIKSDNKIESGFFFFVRLLEFNSEYTKWLSQIRAKYNIPDDGLGYEYKLTYFRSYSSSKGDSGIDDSVEAQISPEEIQSFLYRIRNQYRRYLDGEQLLSIVIKNAVEIPNKKVTAIDESSTIEDVIDYALSNPDATKKEVTDALWDKIEAERYSIQLSEKDLLLLNLKSEGMTYEEIQYEFDKEEYQHLKQTYSFYSDVGVALKRVKERVDKLLQ